jgi:hypothetical protein
MTVDDVKVLANHFLPRIIVLPNKHGCVHNYDALATLLLWYSFPRRLYEMQRYTNYRHAVLSDIINTTARLLVARSWRHLVRPLHLSEERLESYADAVHDHGCPGISIVGFIDGTRRSIAKPAFAQNVFYNGWLHNWSTLWIAIAFPDGSLLLRGPVAGHNNDLGAMQQTMLSRDLDDLLKNFTVGGDDIFVHERRHIITRADFAHLPLAQQTEANRNFSASRIIVEMVFEEITSSFRMFRFTEHQKWNLTHPAVHYRAAAILAIARKSLYPQETKIGQMFDLDTPSLQTLFPQNQ